MAYNVEPQPIPLASTNPTLVSPSHQSAVASTTPMFSWEEDGQSFRWNLFLYNNANTDVDIPTLSFEDIQGTSFSIPAASALQPGHVYAWEVSGEDTSGFNLSEIRTFIVHCTADFDFNGFVDPDDLFAFLDAWFAPSFIADVTNDGLVDADVLFFFLDAWFAGC
jgi:hypothetical protein